MRTAGLLGGGVAALAVAATTAGLTLAGGASTAATPNLSPSNFDHPQQNAYFPLDPGTITRFRGVDDGKHFKERVLVTHKTKKIQGVRATVLLDVLRRADGTVAEKTHDWYAADNDGNVWYLGEATATYDRDGTLRSRGGSWEAGVKGAEAGLIMPADPKPADAYRQEYWPGHAEDQGWIVAAHEKKTVPAGTFDDVVRTYEWSHLEPGVIGLKFYAPDLGPIIDRELGGENFVLVSVERELGG